MFYRLPCLFSISFYFALLSAQILLFGPFFNEHFFYEYSVNTYSIFQIVLNDLTSFFFVFILSCFFFYQNKIYFYIRKNKLRTIIFAMIFVVIYLIVEYLLLQLSALLFLHYFTDLDNEYYNYNSIADVWIEIIANIWLFICIGVILSFMVKCGRKYFQTPLIDGITQSYQQQFMNSGKQLSSVITGQDNRQFCAVIFASVFCCITHGVAWSVYFKLFLAVDEISNLLNDYYLAIFIFALLSVVFNYFFLYHIGQKFIIKTYNWLPVSSLLTASSITAILYGFFIIFIVVFVMPLLFNSVMIFVGMIIFCYIILYYLTRFMIRRYFA